MFSLAYKMTQRDWRSGELRFLLIALMVAVASLTSVGFFVDRLRAGLAGCGSSSSLGSIGQLNQGNSQ